MSFSPVSFVLSVAITSSAVGCVLMAPDRHYHSQRGGGASFWIEEDSGSLLAYNISENTDICERPRSLDAQIRQEIDTVELGLIQTKKSVPSLGEIEYIPTLTLVIPPEETLEYKRNWTSQCFIPKYEQMVAAAPIDAKMLNSAVPISHYPAQEVSACLKIDRQGDVIDFKYAHPAYALPIMEQSPSMAKQIEKVARKCWKFENLTGADGWIQVGLDKRIMGSPS